VILVDSNVLIDIYDRDPQWFDWSSRQIDEALGRDSLAVTPVVVAEVGPRFGRLDDFLTSLRRFAIGVEALTEEAAFRGGVAFRTHRAARGPEIDPCGFFDRRAGGGRWRFHFDPRSRTLSPILSHRSADFPE